MKTNYEVIDMNWEDIKDLSRKILKEIEEKNIEIDTLVPILRGGMPLALILASNIKNLKTACIHVRRSLTNDINSEFGKAKIVGISNVEEIEGKNVLLTEDIIDFGYTLDEAVECVKKYNPKKIYIASFINFNKEKYKDIICGKYFDDQRWIVFPWEEKLYGKEN